MPDFCNVCYRDSITSLPIHFQTQFNLLVLILKTLNGLGTGYLKDHFHPYQIPPNSSKRFAFQALLSLPSKVRWVGGDYKRHFLLWHLAFGAPSPLRLTWLFLPGIILLGDLSYELLNGMPVFGG